MTRNNYPPPHRERFLSLNVKILLPFVVESFNLFFRVSPLIVVAQLKKKLNLPHYLFVLLG
jgi:hypothetical protein